MCELLAQNISNRSSLDHLDTSSLFAPSNEQLAACQTLQTNKNPVQNIYDPDQVIKPNHFLTAITHQDGALRASQVRWGWSPVWSMGTRPPLTHLPLEIVMRSRVFKRMHDSGRALVAVDGWFDAAVDQPAMSRSRFHYVRRRSGQPVYLAAVAQISQSANGCNGLVLVTKGGGGASGPLQLLAFSAENALLWLDPELDVDQARLLPSLDISDQQLFEEETVSYRSVQKNR
ncbi:SOS response-associated peptidase family protein [Pseudomonas sp. JDS28PS106]|uniref:SOS response-associated peptidase family protein n=1 Tax=Pseudomonas sp. JDS28PS106 TaxID=2497235 RepID=UPI002FD03543